MKYHQGRLIDHIHLRVSNLESSRRFYRVALETLGMGEAYGEGDGYFYADELYVDESSEPSSNVHLAFRAATREQVDAFHQQTLQAGGRDNGRPGLRHYHDRYYAAYVLDPDGNNIEAVCDAPTKRSTESVIVERI